MREQQRAFTLRGVGFRDTLKDLLVQPAGSWLDVLPAMVHELAVDLGKKVSVLVRGGDLEIDRRVLDAMRTAVLHLLRNAIDHGLETPEERSARGKPPTGTLEIILSQAPGGQFAMTVKDDGRGLNFPEIREGAVRAELLTRDEVEKLGDAETAQLIFRSGVSSSKVITEISGRGVGMAIVRDTIERLGGTVSVSSELSKGTQFSILLPARLSAFRGILVSVSKEKFCFPAASVERVFRLDSERIRQVTGISIIDEPGEVIPVHSLGGVLQVPGSQSKTGKRPVVLVRSGGSKTAFIVDQILGEREVLVKGLGRQLTSVNGISGVTILESGEVIPVLNIQELVGQSHGTASSEHDSKPIPRQRLLVVEDSITSRVLLKSIFESAGFETDTATDGVDALEAMTRSRFDAIISDVEMPRMNGFELVRRIRDDETWRDLPIILVTSLASPEDRKRGLESGANAYFIKSSFNQDDILNVVRRFVA